MGVLMLTTYRRISMVVIGFAFATTVLGLVRPESWIADPIFQSVAKVLFWIGTLKMIFIIPWEHRFADANKIFYTVCEAIMAIAVPYAIVMVPIRIQNAMAWGDLYEGNPLLISVMDIAVLVFYTTVAILVLACAGRAVGAIIRR